MGQENIISKHRNFGKAVIALAKWLPAPETNPQMTEGNVICTAKHEYCKSPKDVKKARTTARLIALTEQKAWAVLDIEKPNSTTVNIYERFASDMPITTKERDYLLWFFRDKKSFKIAQDIFSKVNLLYWNENKYFIEAYFENTSEKKLDIVFIVHHLMNELEEYKLIIPECENLKELVNWNDLVPEARYFEYKVNSKTQICAVSDWEIYFLGKDLESVKILDNWMIFWVSENINPRLEFKQIWYLYSFYNKKYFFEVEKILWVVDLEIIPSVSWNLDTTLKTQNENWKKWLLEILSEKQDNNTYSWSVKWLSSNEFNDILINDKFITTTLWQESEKINVYNTYIKQPDWLKLIANSYSEHGFEIKDVWDNLVSISTSEWMSLLRFNKEESRLEVIDSALTKVKYFDIANLLNWKPTIITRENWNNWVYIFDKKTWKFDILIFWGNSYLIVGDIIQSKVGNKYTIHFRENWVLYKLKKWYKYIYDSERNYIIEKWFFWSKQHIFAEFRIEEMKEYLEPVNENELPVDLK
ncbi:MAG: hypothetical protein ACD_49C00009G0032 [uncultured bacterium (gcode 4)]|uniref:Uncharacterized protein n=1 Tax=uncultured bacterium (gcode 4) TaxID=1234023 RepID=K2AYI1_9BACT|nr:MAG: hypothetical protein ACD_49C00009G0032 [uncultured bacterium (gcode 4)]